LVTGKLFEDIREAVYAQADPDKLDAIVIPEPCTDIPSETEENTVKPQGRPARRSSATARA
jgi:hypothetical protein